ncbi:LysR substrate-binding domain-containing protein [Lysobacter yananisis]|uniref:Transcriptional regulator, LysR family n=2 Tax=Lysobacter TaxID=68 RepID=A0A0S2DMH8_LYSEN|nr:MULTISPECIES: LysR substrate-binding domain-containing protein [Lysobacter]ALN59730.1 transcriptional regulator, LysR family [Lysobacter enzymogenes]QCW27826.1 LysR family transcriptional regulator [Lysobacter enzymogenes]WMT05373.1 LysR substrate-binding domain-containing protein [Lysobacter yananisis]
MLNLNDLVLFATAVESGGFAAASRRLGVPKSTISKRVAALEDELGARLIHRTSRSFVLTDTGRDFHEHARAALIETEAAENAVRRLTAEPSGKVRITCGVPTAQDYLAPHLPALARAYPRLQVEIDVSDRFVDLVQEGYDIGVRSHFAPLPDSGLIQRQAAVEAIVLVAAPAYLQERGTPQSAQELAGHDGLLTGPGNTAWTLCADGGERVVATPRARMVANEGRVLAAAAVAGLGIAVLPERLCAAELGDGRLLRVLPGWNAGTVTTSLLMPHRRGQLPGVRATVEFLVECLSR